MYSKDLVNWEIISYIYDRFEETPRYSLEDGTVYGRGQWATSLRYHNGKFYAYFTPNDQPAKGYVYTTEDPRGKWERHAVIPHFHDASLFFDEDGKVYMVYGTGQIRELKPDLTGVLEGGLDMKLFERDKEENSLLEGSRMIKKDGRYYMLSSWCTGWAPNQGKWSTATAMDGEWSALYDFGDELTYRSQPAYVLQKDGRDIYVGDRWEGDGDKYFTSTYIILDIKYDENGCPYIDWDENAAF